MRERGRTTSLQKQHLKEIDMSYKEETRTVKVTVRSGGQRKQKTVEIKADTGLFLKSKPPVVKKK